MNLTRVHRWVIFGSVGVIVFLLNVFLFLAPIISDAASLRQTYKNNLAVIQDLQGKVSKKQEMEQEKKFYKFRLVELNDRLPNYLVPEKFVVMLKKIIVDNKLSVDDLFFNNPEEYTIDVKPQYPSVGPVSTKADRLITGLFANDENKGIKAGANELQFASISDEKPVKVDVKFKFEGGYSQIKNVVKAFDANTSTIVIKSISVKANENKNSLDGEMMIALCGFKDSKVPVYNLWDSLPEKGKVDLFGKGSLGVVNYDESKNSDFDILLNPVTYDAPSVIIGKHGVYGTQIYGDNKGMEQVEIRVSERGGKYYYKYKTQTKTYPSSYSEEKEFSPSTPNDIVVKVFSKQRVSSVDNAGIDLTVYNSTNRNINVIPYNDDKENPRVKVTIRK